MHIKAYFCSGDYFEEVEIFGCPDNDGFYPVADYPLLINIAGGTFVHGSGVGEDVESVDHVIVCGGQVGCEDLDNCPFDLTSDCYGWEPAQNEWVQLPSLLEPRWAHLMPQVRTEFCCSPFPTKMT